jgi:hypothetical protein
MQKLNKVTIRTKMEGYMGKNIIALTDPTWSVLTCGEWRERLCKDRENL